MNAQAVAEAIVDAARKRILWERAQEMGERIFEAAQAHRAAEQRAREVLQKAIDDEADVLRKVMQA